MSQISKYSIDVAKLGFEVETHGYKFNDKDTDPATMPKPKGKVLYVFRVDKAGKLTRDTTLELSDVRSDLIVTAESSGVNNNIRTEFIYGGKSGQPLTRGGNKSKNAAFRIVQWIERWRRINSEDLKTIRVQPGPNEAVPNPPRNAGYSVLKRDSNPQMATQITVGIPLAGFYLIIKNDKYLKQLFYTQKPDIDPATIEGRFVAWVQKQNGDWKGTTYKENYTRATALGFLFILQAYVSVARTENPQGDNSLKTKVPFMPRTDFRTMLHIVCDTMKPKAAEDFRAHLDGFFSSHENAGLDKVRWSFENSTGTQGGASKVTVKSFLDDLKSNATGPDLITFGDKNRNSQIGDLGKKVERILDGKDDKLIGPIIEFRSLQDVQVNGLWSLAEEVWKRDGHVVYDEKASSLLQDLEETVKKIHDEARALNTV